VRLLVDANLSPRVAEALRADEHEAVHVAEIGLGNAADIEIVVDAEAEGLVVITADTDFPMLMALRRTTNPSIVLMRGINELAPHDHAQLLIANLPIVASDLGRGAIVSLGPDHLRVRTLPLS
jgi:predicted nuclease of predicted toxin-antitoxin system